MKSEPQNHWPRPPENSFIINVDAAVNRETNRFAIEGVVRDNDGRMFWRLGSKV